MPPLINKWFQREVRKLADHSQVFHHRERVTIAQINAGYTLLNPARLGKYRLCDLTLIAIGGAAAGATSVDVKGTRSGSSVSLLVAAVAALTQSTVARIGAANMVVLADGASFTALDVNTAITIIKNGSDLTTATHIDVLMEYAVDNF